ncbi:unnamed protein product [Ambrosiozyma monospora]|uniref:Unnamed protein product n=1 Tax=Ambrosiozyma monospora TaxID=43982 RepID=A0ACB5SSS2_AMBMO|nr:unnamed protein product [Ambrosiozyma monospora]
MSCSIEPNTTGFQEAIMKMKPTSKKLKPTPTPATSPITLKTVNSTASSSTKVDSIIDFQPVIQHPSMKVPHTPPQASNPPRTPTMSYNPPHTPEFSRYSSPRTPTETLAPKSNSVHCVQTKKNYQEVSPRYRNSNNPDVESIQESQSIQASVEQASYPSPESIAIIAAQVATQKGHEPYLDYIYCDEKGTYRYRDVYHPHMFWFKIKTIISKWCREDRERRIPYSVIDRSY